MANTKENGCHGIPLQCHVNLKGFYHMILGILTLMLGWLKQVFGHINMND
jgi:hypothetical protein